MAGFYPMRLTPLSYSNAKQLGGTGLKAMQERGRVQVGMIADLALFDPDTVAARASYKAGDNGLPSKSIPWIILNGTIVVRNSEVQHVLAGPPIRFPVEAKGHFEAVEWHSWLDEQTVIASRCRITRQQGSRPAAPRKPEWSCRYIHVDKEATLTI
jgi:hypothetical protein